MTMNRYEVMRIIRREMVCNLISQKYMDNGIMRVTEKLASGGLPEKASLDQTELDIAYCLLAGGNLHAYSENTVKCASEARLGIG